MRIRLIFALAASCLVALPGPSPAQETPQQSSPVDPIISDAPVLRARNEVNRVELLVSGGVLPHARLRDAQDALADAQEDFTIRAALSKRDLSIDEADHAVLLTQRRVERRQKALDERRKLADEGIIARNETADYESSLAQAKNQLTWSTERAKLAREIADLARTEQSLMLRLEAGKPVPGLVEHFVGSNGFSMAQFPAIEKAFEARFAHALPISALGETDVHKSLGFDHRNRIDIALVPDQTEGQWLRTYLKSKNIPFFAFRSAIAHQATGAHIHIGPPSDRYTAQSNPKPRVVSGTD